MSAQSQDVVALPASERNLFLLQEEIRPVTYQITARALDGMVIASDQCELAKADFGSVAIQNKLRKIYIAGPFAWALSGGLLGPTFCGILQRALNDALNDGVTDEQAIRIMENCGRLAHEDYQTHATGAAGESIIIFACGRSKKIFRAAVSPAMQAVEVRDTKCISGNHQNLAAFIPTRFHSRNMTALQVASLTTYSIRAAHEIDPLLVDGLDIAIYRDSTGSFKFENADEYWDRAQWIDEAIRKVW